MKLLTFLGATTAHETTYVMPDGREHTAPFCGAALARFCPDTEMRVFVTKDAKKMHWARVGHARNDLLHAGKRPDAKGAEVLERMIGALCQRLNELPLPE